MSGESAGWMAWLLREAGYPREGELVERLGMLASAKASILQELYERIGLDVVTVTTQRVLAEGSLTKKDVRKIRDLWHESQCLIESSVSQAASSSPSTYANLMVLHLFGVLSFTSNGEIAFFLHPDLSAANLRRLANFGRNAAVRHIEQIAAIRESPLSPAEIRERYDFHVREFSERLNGVLASATRPWVRPNRRVRVDVLPTSADFYWAGSKHYDTRPGKNRPFTVFSTTPGLFLPEDRYGAAFFRDVLGREDLAQAAFDGDGGIRDRYFNALMSTSKPRIYHFELERAQLQYQRTVSSLSESERALYDAYAYRMLTAALKDPAFGLVRIRRFPPEFDHLTLGNGSSVVLSTDRTRQDGRIGHGMWVRPVGVTDTRAILRELNLRSAVESSLTATASYMLADGTESLVPELGTIALTLFYAPIIYMLARSGAWRPRAAREAFENFSERLRFQSGTADRREIKRVGDSRPIVRITSIQDLFQ